MPKIRRNWLVASGARTGVGKYKSTSISDIYRNESRPDSILLAKLAHLRKPTITAFQSLDDIMLADHKATRQTHELRVQDWNLESSSSSHAASGSDESSASQRTDTYHHHCQIALLSHTFDRLHTQDHTHEKTTRWIGYTRAVLVGVKWAIWMDLGRF